MKWGGVNVSNIREHVDCANAESSSDGRINCVTALLDYIHANDGTYFVLTCYGSVLRFYQMRRIANIHRMPYMIFVEVAGMLVQPINHASMPYKSDEEE